MKSLPIVLGIAVFALVGCDHKLQMTVNNVTPETRDVAVSVGGQGPRHVGTVRAGGSLKRDIKIPKNELPTELRWSCGGMQGVETIDRKQKKIVINVDRDTAVVTDGKAQIEHHTERQTILDVRSTTVVE